MQSLRVPSFFLVKLIDAVAVGCVSQTFQLECSPVGTFGSLHHSSSSLVDGRNRYLCVWVLKGDLVISELLFKKSSCLLRRKALYVTHILFASVNNLQSLAILCWLVFHNSILRNPPSGARNYQTTIYIPLAPVLRIH